MLNVERIDKVEKGLEVLRKERRSDACAWKVMAWSDMKKSLVDAMANAMYQVLYSQRNAATYTSLNNILLNSTECFCLISV